MNGVPPCGFALIATPGRSGGGGGSLEVIGRGAKPGKRKSNVPVSLDTSPTARCSLQSAMIPPVGENARRCQFAAPKRSKYRAGTMIASSLPNRQTLGEPRAAGPKSNCGNAVVPFAGAAPATVKVCSHALNPSTDAPPGKPR